jgi:hypothetical protein
MSIETTSNSYTGVATTAWKSHAPALKAAWRLLVRWLNCIPGAWVHASGSISAN